MKKNENSKKTDAIIATGDNINGQDIVITEPAKQTVRGYKVVLPNGTSNHSNIVFEVGKEYKHTGAFKICESGFHFCTKPSHCFDYYEFNPANKVFEVEAIGDVQYHDADSKACTNNLHIVREIGWSEVLNIVNEGVGNTGFANTGNRNTGNSNTGYSNTGNRNTGNSNTGYSNTGYSNTGNRNTGNRNTGNWNTGNRNTGNWNTGDRNTGYSNTGYRNTGAFCTYDAPFPMFNKPSHWTEKEFKESRAYMLLCGNVDTKIWVDESIMSAEEKTVNPSHKTTGGYLKDVPYKEAFKNAWHNWSADNRSAFTSLPNFDKDIFFEITGVKID